MTCPAGVEGCEQTVKAERSSQIKCATGWTLHCWLLSGPHSMDVHTANSLIQQKLLRYNQSLNQTYANQNEFGCNKFRLIQQKIMIMRLISYSVIKKWSLTNRFCFLNDNFTSHFIHKQQRKMRNNSNWQQLMCLFLCQKLSSWLQMYCHLIIINI